MGKNAAQLIKFEEKINMKTPKKELTVRFTYTEEVVPPRCRKPREQQFKDEVTVNIIDLEQLTPEEQERLFPVALVIHPSEDNVDGKEPQEIRGYAPQQLFKRIKQNFLYEELSSGAFDWDKLNRYSGQMPRENNESDIRKWARDLILAHGAVWQRAIGEPGYRVMTFGLGHGDGTAVFLEWLTHEELYSSGSEFFFLADEYEEARKKAILVAEGRHDIACAKRFKNEKQFSHGYVEVLRQEYLMFQPLSVREAYLLRMDAKKVIAGTFEMPENDVNEKLVDWLVRKMKKAPGFNELKRYERKDPMLNTLYQSLKDTALREEKT